MTGLTQPRRKKVLLLLFVQGDGLSRVKHRILGVPFSRYQFGYFYDSLRACCDVQVVTSLTQLARYRAEEFDWTIVDFRSIEFFCKRDPSLAIARLLPLLPQSPKALLLRNPNASVMPPDQVLDKFSVVFKREAFKDRDRYLNLSGANRRKIHTTMLPCPFLRLSKGTEDEVFRKLQRKFPHRDKWMHDVYFRGAPTTPSRAELVEALASSNLRFEGGITNLRSRLSRLTMAQYLSEARHLKNINISAINLALEGFGQFTFRHLEIWALGGFCLSAPSLPELDLPLPVVEGVHYHCFRTPESIVSDCRELLAEPYYLRRVGSRAQDLMREYYSPAIHGASILRTLDCC